LLDVLEAAAKGNKEAMAYVQDIADGNRFYSNEDLTLNKNSIRTIPYKERKLQIIKMNISIMIIYLIIILLYKYSLFKKT
jgi:hypothetical protein